MESATAPLCVQATAVRQTTQSALRHHEYVATDGARRRRLIQFAGAVDAFRCGNQYRTALHSFTSARVAFHNHAPTTIV